MYYKEKYGITYYYEPESNLPDAATATAMNAESTGTVVITGSNTVLQTANYQFTFDLTVNVKAPNTTPTPTLYDYIAFQFPDSMFDKYAIYSATADVAGDLYIFGISNMIYFSPTA